MTERRRMRWQPVQILGASYLVSTVKGKQCLGWVGYRVGYQVGN